MDINTMILEDTIEFDVELSEQKQVLSYITEILEKTGRIDDKEKVLASYIEREEEGTTGIGFGLAIPHCKSDSVKEPTIVYMTLKDLVEWEALDGEPIKYIIALAIPKKDEGTLHLEILSSLASNLMEDDFKDALFAMNDKTKLINFLKKNI